MYKHALRPNFPNPFNLSTEIPFDLPEDAIVSLVVYDVLGREVVVCKILVKVPLNFFKVPDHFFPKKDGEFSTRFRYLAKKG